MPACDHDRGLHAAAAGASTPYETLTPAHVGALWDLSRGSRPDRALVSELGTLSLAADNGVACLVVDRAEVERVDAHARVAGAGLATVIRREAAGGDFFTIGDRLLDNGLLDALARDATLMPPAPRRPNPGDREGRYYFWVIEGAHENLGRYGQRAFGLAGGEWYFATFGEYANPERSVLERRAAGLDGAPPRELADALGIPVEEVDADRERRICDELVAEYRRHDPSLRDLHASLATPGPAGFGEFFCWFDHLAYAHAIDDLAASGDLAIPAERFAAAVVHEPERGAF